MTDELLTPAAVAELLQIELNTVRTWLAHGLASQQSGDGDILIRRSDLDAFLAKANQGVARDAASEV